MDHPFSVAEVVPAFDHEVRNAASIVLSNLEFLRLDEQDPARREALDDAHRAAARIQRLTADLRAVALEPAREPAALRPIAAAALERARRVSRSSLACELRGDGAATIDAELVGRVLEDVFDAVLHDERARGLQVTIAAGGAPTKAGGAEGPGSGGRARITLAVEPNTSWPRLGFHRLSLAAQGGALEVNELQLVIELPVAGARAP